MRIETKAQIARATLTLLAFTASLFLLGMLVVVLCVGLQINPFRETTTSFLVAAFGGVIGVASVLVLLNVATNISLIADARIAELNIEPSRGTLKKWTLGFVGLAIAAVVVIFGGTYFSKERYLAVVHKQADEVLQKNSNLLDEISSRLASGKPEDFKRVIEIRQYLESQRDGLPSLTIIYPGRFADKLALLRVNNYISETKDNGIEYSRQYYVCSQNVDCDYLTRYFEHGDATVLEKYTIRDDEFYIYIPHSGKESKFVMLFERRNRYGKMGS